MTGTPGTEPELLEGRIWCICHGIIHLGGSPKEDLYIFYSTEIANQDRTFIHEHDLFNKIDHIYIITFIQLRMHCLMRHVVSK